MDFAIQSHRNNHEDSLFAHAEGLSLRTKQGCPYAGVTLDVHKGQLTALRGPSGSGKTALLLTLAGRMSSTEGTLNVLGVALPKGRGRVQKQVGLGLFDGVNDLPENVLVERVVATEFHLHGAKPTKEALAAFFEANGLQHASRMLVKDLSREKLVELGISLALIGDPCAIVVDNVEDRLAARQSERLMQKLADIAHERNIAVIVACTDRNLARMADAVYQLG